MLVSKNASKGSTLALKPRANITRSPGVSEPKKVLYPPKLKKKQLNIVGPPPSHLASETPDIRFCITSG